VARLSAKSFRPRGAPFDVPPAFGYPASAMIDSIISGLLYYFIVYAGPVLPALLLLAHLLAEDSERAAAREISDMPNTTKPPVQPAPVHRAQDRSAAPAPTPARPGQPTGAPLARPVPLPRLRTEAPVARPSPAEAVQAARSAARPTLAGPLQPAPAVTHARSVRDTLIQHVLDHPAHSVTHAAPRGSGAVAQSALCPRPATNAERQAAFRARHGDDYRSKNAARMRASRAKQRGARLHAAECQELAVPLVAS
jgi:hypothetical protein